jgi:hypothetical protein
MQKTRAGYRLAEIVVRRAVARFWAERAAAL